ncbi:MAG: putative monovalent cation/H+ antiporter subunit A [Pararhizobium sp.]
MNADGARVMMTAMMLPFVAAAFAPYLVRLMGHRAVWVLALAPLSVFLLFASFAPGVGSGAVLIGGYPWVPAFGVTFSWAVDGLSLVFALLISGIGTLIVLYSGGYLKGHPDLGRFLSFIFLFMGAMLGLVLADDFLMLFVYWELTSIASFLLIGFDHEREAARRAALQALIVTGAGGLALLAGLLVLGAISGATRLSELSALSGIVRESPLMLAALIPILAAAFTKSAQFPLHFWLPNAMEAPTPVSAYLHSATMVKAGVYLLMRRAPVFAATAVWQTVLPVFGGLTLVAGALLAVRQTDMKLMLAYTTTASLGLLVMMTGFGSTAAIEGAVLYLIAHALFKGGLFMVAGLIDHEAGSRDIRAVGGLRAAMPVTFAAALAGAISMGGVPPGFGFLAKEEIYSALGRADAWTLVFLAAAVVGNGLMLVIGFAIALNPFLGQPKAAQKAAHEGPVLLWLGPAVLGLLGILLAIVSPFAHAVLSSPMASAVGARAVHVEATLVPHVGLPLALSLATIVFGILVYRGLEPARAAIAGTLRAIGWGPDRGFDQAMRGLLRFAHRLNPLMQPGSLEVYMTVTFVVAAAALLVPMIAYGELPAWPTWPSDAPFYELVVIAIALIGLAAVIVARDRLTAIVSLGVQGFAVALIFMLYGAPDLSFTQFMVEALSVVILALVMTRLRLAPADHRPLGEMLVDFVVAAAGGLGFMLFLMKVTQGPFDNRLSDFFSRFSEPIAHGHNIVNVIIVDFRGTDTLGEISVVMITGLAILALIRIQAGAREAPLADNELGADEAGGTD